MARLESYGGCTSRALCMLVSLALAALVAVRHRA
jgi:hypothetical protein